LAIVGSGVLLASFATQSFCSVSQNPVEAQSPSTAQALFAPQIPEAQTVERHTFAASFSVQGPLPSASPHLPSRSQTPLRHTPATSPVVQAPSPLA
jgi:hypothetical protein